MGVLSDADYAAMAKGNLAKKREILSQADAIYLDQVQRQNQGLQERRLNEDIRQFDVVHPADWSPSAQEMTKDGRGYLVTKTSPFQGNVQKLDPPSPPLEPMIDPTTKKVVPGWFRSGNRFVNTNASVNPYDAALAAALNPTGAVKSGAAATPAQPKPPGTPADGDVIRARDKTGTMRTWRFNAKNPDQSTLIE
jgi:hypothetical protein